VKLSGRAHAETIVKLLEELNALAERDPAVRVLIDETDLGASERYRKDREGVAERRLARLDRDRGLRFQPRYLRAEPHVSRSRGRSRAGERLQRSRTCEGLAS
jgi:hypothetical protein